MKMKLYSAATRDEAIALAYADMGQDAIILSEWEAESGFEIRAGVERATQRATPQFELKAAPRPSPKQTNKTPEGKYKPEEQKSQSKTKKKKSQK